MKKQPKSKAGPYLDDAPRQLREIAALLRRKNANGLQLRSRAISSAAYLDDIAADIEAFIVALTAKMARMKSTD